MERPGHVTAETTAAIRNYQSIAGLAPDGRPSAELLASLRAVAGRDAPR
jgi:peptidoglycan hydrolase-like protein with peptidoglycan-binding domain